MKKMTLDKILQQQGFGSRKECQALIVGGSVRLNDQVIESYDEYLEPETLGVLVNDEHWVCREQVYVALNKPSEFECSRKPTHHPSVLNLLPPLFSRRNTQPVGRLDQDTTGLLLFSDDGIFIHQQSSPKYRQPKTYEATTDERITPELVSHFLTGIQLKEEPSPIAALSCNQLDSHRIEIILGEGKYHQIKRMLAAEGFHCKSLIRTKIGRLRLEDLHLSQGQWCFLSEAQLLLLAPPQH